MQARGNRGTGRHPRREGLLPVCDYLEAGSYEQTPLGRELPYPLPLFHELVLR